MDYLGLGPDDAYDDYDASVAVERPAARNTRGGAAGAKRVQRPVADDYEDDVDQDDDYKNYDDGSDDYDDYEEPKPRVRSQRPGPVAGGRTLPQRDDSSVQLRPSGSTTNTVRKMPPTAKQQVAIRPTRYDQAKDIADLLKSGQAVAMNIGAADAEIARRLIDFASGVIYGIDGKMEKLAPGVFLLTPRGTRTIRD